MRQVRRRPFSDYFNPNLEEVDSIALNLPFTVRWKRVINPFSIVTGVLLASFLMGLYSNMALSFFLSFGSFVIYTYFRVKAVSQRLHVQRSLSTDQLFEFDELKVRYKIINTSGVHSPPLRLKDVFEASQNRLLEVEIEDSIRSNAYKSIEVTRRVDGGMGHKKIGGATLYLSDPFGIFEFSIAEDHMDTVEVLPKIDPIPGLPFEGSPQSERYGVFDVQAKGNSVNFVGVREYVRGDSLKNIAWKVSAKKDELYVKEFENMVNAEVSLFLNLRPNVHQGAPGFSTWELTKDIALSLVTQQIEQANTVRVFTQEFYIESLRGEQDTHELAQQLIKVDPLKRHLDGELTDEWLGNTPSATKLLNQYIDMQKPGSNVLLISPFLTSESESLKQTLYGLRQLGCNVFVVLVDSWGFYRSISKRLDHRTKFTTPTMVGIEELADQLSVLGITVTIVDSERAVTEAFLKARTAL